MDYYEKITKKRKKEEMVYKVVKKKTKNVTK